MFSAHVGRYFNGLLAGRLQSIPSLLSSASPYLTEAGAGEAVLRGERTALSTAAARAHLDLVWEAPCRPKQDHHSRLPGLVPMLAK